MPLVKTANELEIAWLKAALGGSSKSNLSELQWLFYSANSGLIPVARFSLVDHQKAFYAAQSGVSAKNSISDLERAYFNSKGSLSNQSYQDQAFKFWRDIPFSGGSLPVTSGLAAWYDASQIAGAVDGAAVASWPDMSGNTKHAVQATGTKQPLYRTSVVTLPNGKPVVQFDGVDDFLATASAARSLAGDYTSFLVSYVIGGAAAVPGFGGHLDEIGSGAAGGFCIQKGAPIRVDVPGNGNQNASPAPASDYTAAAWNVYSFNFNGTTPFTTTTNGVVSTGAVAAGTGPAAFSCVTTLGARQGGGQNVPALIAEVIQYNRILTTPERQSVEAYLKTKYGTP